MTWIQLCRNIEFEQFSQESIKIKQPLCGQFWNEMSSIQHGEERNVWIPVATLLTLLTSSLGFLNYMLVTSH